MKGAACGFALVLLSSCGDKPSGSTEAAASESPKKFVVHMESAQEEIKALKDAIDRKEFGDSIRARLASVRRHLSAAQELAYPKKGVDAAKLRAAFRKFLDHTLKELEEAAWDANSGAPLWKKLQSGCASCHQQFRE